VAAPRAADFLARHRGGGLFTETVNQRIGAHLSVLAHRTGLSPSALTLANLVIGLATSIAVIALASQVPDIHLALGLGALLLWHLAYSLDCADGQLARVTGRASPAGARLDILCDVAAQTALVGAIVSATVAVAADGSGWAPPPWLYAVFAATWMVNLVTSVLQQGGSAHSLVASRSMLVRVVKLSRDFGAVLTVVGLTLALVPQLLAWLVLGFTVLNGGFLLASIAATARAAFRHPH
jgi:phosphatidylglycerophosphate synthase